LYASRYVEKGEPISWTASCQVVSGNNKSWSKRSWLYIPKDWDRLIFLDKDGNCKIGCIRQSPSLALQMYRTYVNNIFHIYCSPKGCHWTIILYIVQHETYYVLTLLDQFFL
jgi:hypothetical protein